MVPTRLRVPGILQQALKDIKQSSSTYVSKSPGLLDEALAEDRAKEASRKWTAADLERLRDDIADRMFYEDTESAAKIVPKRKLRKKIQTFDGIPMDRDHVLGAVGGAAAGGLLLAGLGGVTTGLSQGRHAIVPGMLQGALPGVIGGGVLGHRNATKRQLLEALTEELGPGARVKKAKVEVGFKEILEELHTAKKAKTLTSGEMKAALKDLKMGRGYPLTPPEKLVLRRVILGKVKTPARTTRKTKYPVSKALQCKCASTTPRLLQGENLLIAGGAVEAFSALGLGTPNRYNRWNED